MSRKRRRERQPASTIEQALARAEQAALKLGQAQHAVAVEMDALHNSDTQEQRQRVIAADQAVHAAATQLERCTDAITLRLRPVHARLSAIHRAMLDWAEAYSATVTAPLPAPTTAALVLDLDPQRN